MRVTIFIMLTLAMALLSLYCYGIWDGYDALSPEDSLVEIDFRIFQRGGQSVPSIGQIRVCVIFVDRETGEYTPNAQYWPSPGNPSYQNVFLENSNFDPSTPGFQWLSDINITKYFWDMSRGAYRVVGDTYRFTLPRPYPSAISDTTSYGSINNYILSSMDSAIDFGIYDNWTFSNYNHVNQPDGLVDMVFIAYRSPLNGVRLDPPVNVYGPSEGFSGISGLLTSYTSDDVLPSGQHIVVSNGTTQGSCLSGHLVARDIILHELGHKLIRGGSVGDHTGRIANLGLLNANQVGFDASKGMCAWERELLGWIDYTTISSDAIVTLHDMITTSEPPYALKIPAANPDRYYVIKNRQGSSIFNAAYDKGIYIYRVSEQSAGGITGIQSTQVYNPRNVPEPGGTGSWSPQNITGNNYDGLVNVLCADGRWNFEKSRGSSCYPTITTPISAHSTKASPSMKSKRNTPSPVLSRPRQSC